MDGRISLWTGVIVLVLGCAGCVTTQNKNQATLTPQPPPAPVPAAPRNDEPVNVTKAKPGEDGPKRKPKAATEVAYGQLKEADAESDFIRSNLGMQAQYRDEARQAYQKAIEIDANHLDGYRCLARLYTKMGDYERAFDIYQKAMTKNARDPVLWFELGLCHNRRKDFNQSIPCFQKALEFAPGNREYQKVLGFTLAYNGHFEQALTYLTRAQGLAMAHYNLAQVMVHRQQFTQARQHLQLALRENPQYQEARELLGSLQGPAAS